jgi:hypothetical protein
MSCRFGPFPVHRDWAPLGADRFSNLVENRFFANAPSSASCEL